MAGCPKCGFPQPEETRCPRCGFRLDRQGVFPPAPPRPAPASLVATPPRTPEPVLPEPRKPGVVRRVFRVGRWVALSVSLVVLVLLLRPAAPPEVKTDPQAAERVQAKVEHAAQTAVEGGTPVLQLDEAELNAWIQSNLALATPPTPDPPRAPGSPSEPTLQEVQSSLRDVKINLVGDELRAYVLFNLYGKDLTL